jgi:hypothetical protein
VLSYLEGRLRGEVKGVALLNAYEAHDAVLSLKLRGRVRGVLNGLLHCPELDLAHVYQEQPQGYALGPRAEGKLKATGLA